MAKTSAELSREYRARHKERLAKEQRQKQCENGEWAENRRKQNRQHKQEKRTAELAARNAVRKTTLAIVIALRPPFHLQLLYADGEVQCVFSTVRLPSARIGLDDFVRVSPRIRTIANHKTRSRTTYSAKLALDFDTDEAENLLRTHWRYLYGAAQWIPPDFTINDTDEQEQTP